VLIKEPKKAVDKDETTYFGLIIKFVLLKKEKRKEGTYS
jgi:hypothetical protein